MDGGASTVPPTKRLSPDLPRRPYRGKQVLYGRGNLTAAWFQPLKLTGNYRMEIQFTRDDVMRLFKCLFGSQLHTSLVEEYGLMFSPELVKSLLTVKMTDLASSHP
jgi:hypothetical protein